MLTVFAGPMFSGKTTALIEQSRKMLIDHIWKPRKDTRDENTVVKSHDGLVLRATVLDSIDQIRHLTTVCIDEFQFLDESLAREVLSYSRISDVYVSMLDMDYRGNDFNNFRLIQEFEPKRLIYKTSRCTVCDGSARFSFRKVKSDDIILCGAEESYEPRCDLHFQVLQLP